MIDNLIQFIARLLSGIYGLPIVGGSYGLAIMLLTLGIMVVVMPLTLKATKSTIKMSMVAPELKRIQKEFKDDKERQNAEMMELYKEHGINPIGGCLPIVAQAPVFLVLFQVIRGLTRRLEETPFYGVVERVAELQGTAAPDDQLFFPRYIDPSSKMFEDLTKTNEMTFLKVFDLGAQPNEILSGSIIKALPYLLLIVFLVATSFYQQRQVTARRPSSGGETQENSVLQQQQAILKFLPFMTGIWSFFFPTGLSVYWATSNTFRIAQQAYITRTIYSKKDEMEASFKAKLDERKKDVPAKTETSEPIESSSSTAEPSNGASPKASAPSGSGSKVEQRRQKELQRRKAIQSRASAKSGSSTSGGGPSTRTTPKGTKPQQKKKKR